MTKEQSIDNNTLRQRIEAEVRLSYGTIVIYEHERAGLDSICHEFEN